MLESDDKSLMEVFSCKELSVKKNLKANKALASQSFHENTQ